MKEKIEYKKPQCEIVKIEDAASILAGCRLNSLDGCSTIGGSYNCD